MTMKSRSPGFVYFVAATILWSITTICLFEEHRAIRKEYRSIFQTALRFGIQPHIVLADTESLQLFTNSNVAMSTPILWNRND